MGLIRQIFTFFRERKKTCFFIVILYLTLVILYQYHYQKLQGIFPSLNPTFPFNRGLNEDSNKLRDSLLKFLSSNRGRSHIDIHVEDPVLGHTGEVNGEGHDHTHRGITVAIGGGLTSLKLRDVTVDNIPEKFQLFFTLLPSFCSTASPDFEYHFYLGYDFNDNFFTDSKMIEAFSQHFKKKTEALCSSFAFPVSLHFVQCSHMGKPAWAQNDAMMEAYLDGIMYFYRINDDSQLGTGNWTHAFVKTLSKYNPPNIGVVGPNHAGGNTAIMTYDFVHHTHVEIFGFYYPRLFSDWYADDWVTRVYRPDRSIKLQDIRLVHTMKLGQRYKVDWTVAAKLQGRIDEDQETLKRYIKYKQEYPSPPKPDGRKVISMSLYGKNPVYTMGAVRNAQLLPLFYPDWTLRIYVAKNTTDNKDLIVPARILARLQQLGAQVVAVSSDRIKPQHWRYIVIDDKYVEVFLIRNADARLSERESAAVKHWLENWQPFHCIRDHPAQSVAPVVDGLWGGRSKQLRQILVLPMSDILQMKGLQLAPSSNSSTSNSSSISILSDVIWTLVEPYAYCHDSVSCRMWDHSHTFPVSGRNPQMPYVGEKFTPHETVADPKLREAIKIDVTSCIGVEAPVANPPDSSVHPLKESDVHSVLYRDTNTSVSSSSTASTTPSTTPTTTIAAGASSKAPSPRK